MNTIVLDGVKENVYHEVLDNGMNIYLMPIKSSSSFAITLNVKFGSTNVDFKDNNTKKNVHLPNGVAHFLEHLMFKMEDGSDASSTFASLGSDANAFTSYNQTAYTVNATSKFKENLSILLDMVFNPYFTKENVSEEKGIIVSETKMTDDNIDSKIMQTLNSNLYLRENIKNKICGEVSEVQSITLKDIENAYKYFYHPKNMFVVITGNFNYEEAIAIIEEKMKEKDFSNEPNVTLKKIKEPMKVKNEIITIKSESKKTMLGFKIPLPNKEMNIYEAYNYLSLIFSCNFGRTSEFQSRLLSGNIINQPLSMQVFYTNNYFILYIYADTNYPDRLLTLIKEQSKSLSITKEDLLRKIKVLKSDYILSTDDVDIINSIIQSDIIKFDKLNNKLFSMYDKMNLSTALKFIKGINLKNMVMVRCIDNKK